MANATYSRDAAEQVIAAFLSSGVLEPLGGEVQSIEAVWVSERGHVGTDADAGIRMTWTQGADSFGLLMPLRRLVAQAGHIDSVAVYLRLAVDEPHGPTPDGSVLWFSDLPTETG